MAILLQFIAQSCCAGQAFTNCPDHLSNLFHPYNLRHHGHTDSRHLGPDLGTDSDPSEAEAVKALPSYPKPEDPASRAEEVHHHPSPVEKEVAEATDQSN
ncbi:hypothetical protein PG990_002165 [Apiospora arundinis]